MHRLDDARPGHEGPENRQQKRRDDQGDVPDLEHPAALLHEHRVQERGRGEPGKQPGVLDRVPGPVAAPTQLLVRPDHPEREAKGQDEPAHHGPAPHGAQPRVIEVAGDERRQPEGERNRHPDKPGVERGRVHHHVDVLEQGVQALPVGGRLRQERLERVLVDDHHEQEEHLHARHDRHDVGDELAMPFAVDIHRARSEHGQQEHPEHDRPVEAAPVRGDLVEQGLDRVRVVLDVPDRVVVGHERVNQHGRGQRHQRREEVERADTAFDQPARSATGADDRHRHRVCTHHEGGRQNKRAEGCHIPVLPTSGAVAHTDAFGGSAATGRVVDKIHGKPE